MTYRKTVYHSVFMLHEIKLCKTSTCVGSCCRMTLLLGPPSSGKTTLLLALAGRLGPGLKVRIITSISFLSLYSCSSKVLGKIFVTWFRSVSALSIIRSEEYWHLLLPENEFRSASKNSLSSPNFLLLTCSIQIWCRCLGILLTMATI